MNTIGPALASASQALFTQANGLSDTLSKAPKLTESTTAVSSSAQNTTVTLSDQSKIDASSYNGLKAYQTVNERNSVENPSVERNESSQTQQAERTQGETHQTAQYANQLQMQANYLSAQKAEI
ncbi:hypothetical protein CYQ88_01580 [Hydrogenovibrio sp. SC-1]|uniref:hypothetical protein n=1 Tax=Hydrogenovibrio sp. SC-1 TaxID=2065820 RepID=UPI000C7AA2C2|nr:hypothetical protein [Hydrogenovibrio sp. SC-1]PLA75284.1 hypothetical protein CYQ88_01580 [Hydrogenovibrio sp. SC-1]